MQQNNKKRKKKKKNDNKISTTETNLGGNILVQVYMKYTIAMQHILMDATFK